MDEFNNPNNTPQEEDNKEDKSNSYNDFDEKHQENHKNNSQEGWNSSTYYGYTPPKKPKKNPGTIIAIISSFVIFAMLVTVGYGLFKDTNLSNDNKGDSLGSGITLEQYQKPNGADDVAADANGKYSPEALYRICSPSVVGVLSYSSGYVTASGQGSGVIISEDGYIVTNAHVVNGASAVSVVLPSEDEEIEAKVVGSDARSDIAVLKIDRKELPFIKLGNSADVNVGEMVVAIGNPGGLYLANSLTVGYISGLDREVTVDNYMMNFIQTDAAINPGNSGGALINLYGQLIGINSAKISDEQYEGIGFAIPINDAVPIIESIVDNGYVKGRVRIGITVQEINSVASKYNNIPEGLYIASVDKTCDAYGKVQKGDVITKFEGKEVTTTAGLYALLDDCSPGDTVTLTVYRTSRSSGSYMNIDVKLSEDTGETYFSEE